MHPLAPLGALIGAVLAVVAALEWGRPLPARPTPVADPAHRTIDAPSGRWQFLDGRLDGQAGERWRELRAPSGHRTVLRGRPRRIVSQTLLSDEILMEICERERLTAIGSVSRDPHYSNVVSQAWGFPLAVGDNTEHILALRPDLVIVASYSTVEMVEQLLDAGVAVLRLADFGSFDALRNNIRILGFAVGNDHRAEGLVRALDAALLEIRSDIPDTESAPRVLAWSQGSVPAEGTLLNEALTRVGAVNVAARAGLSGWPRPSAEQIAAWDPDVILVEAAPGEEEEAARALHHSPVLRRIRAVRTGKIVTVPGPLFIVSSHHVVKLLRLLVSELYGS